MAVHHLTACDLVIGQRRAKRPLKPNAAREAKAAIKAGLPLKGVTLRPDGTIELTFDQQSNGGDTTATAFDTWERKHARKT